MRNEIDQFNGYNDTISAMISKMCLDAYEKYDIEKERCEHRQAMARAIGDTFKKYIDIHTQSYSMDSHLMQMSLHKDNDYVFHIEKATFMKFAEKIYDSGNYRIRKYKGDYEYVFKYELALFKIGELRK